MCCGVGASCEVRGELLRLRMLVRLERDRNVTLSILRYHGSKIPMRTMLPDRIGCTRSAITSGLPTEGGAPRAGREPMCDGREARASNHGGVGGSTRGCSARGYFITQNIHTTVPLPLALGRRVSVLCGLARCRWARAANSSGRQRLRAEQGAQDRSAQAADGPAASTASTVLTLGYTLNGLRFPS